MVEGEDNQLCILCDLQGQQNSTRERPEGIGTWNKTDLLLLPQLRVIYLMEQVFKGNLGENSDLRELLQVLGHPDKWFDICDLCGELVDRGIKLWRELKRIEVEHGRVLRRLRERLDESGGDLEGQAAVDLWRVVPGEEARRTCRRNLRLKLRGGKSVEVKVEEDEDGQVEVKEEQEEDEVNCNQDDDISVSDFYAEELDHDLNVEEEPMDVSPDPDEDIDLINEELSEEEESDHSEDNLEPGSDEHSKNSNGYFEEEEDNDNAYAPGRQPPKRRKKKKIIKKKKKKVLPKIHEVTLKPLSPKYKEDPIDEEMSEESDQSDDDFEPSTDEDSKDSDEYSEEDADNDYPFALEKQAPKKRKKKKTVKKKKRFLPITHEVTLKPEVERDPEFARECSKYLNMNLFPYPLTNPQDFAKLEEKVVSRSISNLEEQGESNQKGGYPCPVCPKRFGTWYFAVAHIHRMHLEILKPWSCSQCSKTFADYRRFRLHLRFHVQGKHFTCKLCKKGTNSKEGLEKHVVSHFKEGTMQCKCPECFQMLDNYKRLVDHLTKEHGYKLSNGITTHICELCSHPVKTLKRLRFHKVKLHGEEDPNGEFPICNECGVVCIDKHGLARHVTEHHSGLRWVCDQCGNEYRSDRLLKIHQKLHVAQTEGCRVCGMIFKHLGAHLHRHHPETQDMTEEQLTQYKKRQEEDPQWKCGYCEQKFAYRVVLYHHQRQSHPEIMDKWKCDECGKGFSRGSSLKRHKEEKHLGIKVNCEFCGKEWPKSQIYLHQQTKQCLEKRKQMEESRVEGLGEGDGLDVTAQIPVNSLILTTL